MLENKLKETSISDVKILWMLINSQVCYFRISKVSKQACFLFYFLLKFICKWDFPFFLFLDGYKAEK